MPARFTIKIAAKARADIDALLAYIALESPAAAGDFADLLESEIMNLDRFPLRCPIAPEAEDWGLPVRVLTVGSYRVLFTIRGVQVVVLRVRHGARCRLRFFND